MHNAESIVIVERFFQAVEMLRADHVIRGLRTITTRYGINDRNMRTLRAAPERNIFQPCWLTYLVRDYGVSAEWLLTGEGDFYGGKTQKKRNALFEASEKTL